jgi:integrase
VKTSIKRRDSGRWSVRFDVPSMGGKRRQRRITIKAGTRRDAEALAAEIIHDQLGRGLSEVGRLTVSDLLQEWLQSCQRTVAPKTLDRYWSIVRHHLLPALGRRLLRDLSARDIDQAIFKWENGSRYDARGGKLKSNTVRHHIQTLRTALNFAVRRRYILHNPCAGVRVPKRQEHDVTMLTIDALWRLLQDLDLCIKYAVIFAIGTGMRCGEILGLRWGDVDWQAAEVHVRRSYCVCRGIKHFKVPKTKKSVRSIALPHFAVRSLECQRDAQRNSFEMLGLDPPGEDAVIFDRLGQPWTPSNFSSMFYRATKRAKVPHCRFHDLRHAYATLLLSAGVEIKIVSDSLGHSSSTTTRDTYQKVLPVVRHDAAKRLDALVGESLTIACENA